MEIEILHELIVDEEPASTLGGMSLSKKRGRPAKRSNFVKINIHFTNAKKIVNRTISRLITIELKTSAYSSATSRI